MNQNIWTSIRQALLMIVDAIEREEGIKPRTSELRKFWKDWRDNKA